MELLQSAMNTYSPTWFATFLDAIPAAQTEKEIAFLARQLPISNFQSLLDLCCGTGRHALPLAARGYHVTGVDANAEAIAAARAKANGSAQFIQHDLRALNDLPGTFDAALCLWQSFGHFDEATNAAILQQIACKLNPRGRFILDIYHRDFFATHQGTRDNGRGGARVVETKTMRDNRLLVKLEYAGGAHDAFEWQLYTPDEICNLAASVGLKTMLVCSEYAESVPASADKPRMQIVFEKK
ncbi:MAG: class I SAM-dependent methyltransferase [Chloroflexi bacterium]|nr:class I SAM-dependent methyltransferase [Chloroflexota bacterium]